MKAIWIHGNAAMPQFVGGISIASPGTAGHDTRQVNGQPWTDIVGLPQGPGKIFRCAAGSNFVHFALPTPVVLDGPRSRLERVFVLFKSDLGVEVTCVFAFDGPKNIFQCGGLHGVAGDHSGARGVADLQDNITRFALPDRPEVLFGVGISVEVRFAQEGNITFTAVGADFA